MSNTLADQAILHHLTIGLGTARLSIIKMGLEMEIKHSGARMTAKAPKCSTILRREFGLSGKPPKLLEQFNNLLAKYSITFAPSPFAQP